MLLTSALEKIEKEIDDCKKSIRCDDIKYETINKTIHLKECKVSEKLTQLLERKEIDPGCDFLRARDDWANSQLFAFLKGMPKGGLLHTHGFTTGPFKVLANMIHNDPRLYVYFGETNATQGLFHKSFRYLPKSQVTHEWKPTTEMSIEEILDIMVMDGSIPKDKRWSEMQLCWQRCQCFSISYPIWSGRHSFLWSILESLLESKVIYADIKMLIPPSGHFFDIMEDGTNVAKSIEEFMRVYVDTVQLFRAEHPEFVNAKIVWASLKIFGEDVIKHDIELVKSLEKTFPNFVAGYDLVGEEDKMFPIAKYATELLEYQQQGGTLLLHCGETLNPCRDQLVHAIALNCKRIGHGYAYPFYPELMELVKRRKIIIECCPISNQVLSYIEDFRNHPGRIMLQNGLSLTINSDDGGMFGCDDLTFDFVAATVGWNLSLCQLKAIAKESLTVLDGAELQHAQEIFDHQWEAFLDANL